MGNRPVAIASDGTHMWVVNNNFAENGTVTELNPDGSVAGTFPAGNRPVAIASDGTHMWVTNKGTSLNPPTAP